jgi:DnaK suppressor protein
MKGGDMNEDRAQALLARERQRIEQALAGRAERVGTDELTSQDQHLADAATELYENELEEGLAERLRADLAALERAEARLEAGIYGVSIESGERIPDERLEANPLAERTIDEERRLERER